LVQYRQQLANRRRSIKQRVQAVRREHRIKGARAGAWTQTWIYWLRHHERLSETSRWLIEEHLQELNWVQGRIDRVEAKLDESTENDHVVQRLRRLPGIGAVTAWALRASIGRFDRFRSAKALARYCGLSPKNDSSGDHRRQRGLIADADRQLRALLIQAGHRLLRRSDRWGQLGQHLLAQGKAKSVAVAAVTNRWLRWIYHRMLEPEA
jgi:transposase